MNSPRAQFEVTLVRSLAGLSESQKRTLAALGLHRRGQSRIHGDSPAFRGQVLKVQAFVKVKRLSG